MTIPTHLLAGMVIGKLTNNYGAALAGSVLIDLDHIISYSQHKILFKPKVLLKTMRTESDPWQDQRNILHSVFSFAIIIILLALVNFSFGLVFGLAYIAHLTLDMFDSADFHPFFPFKKINLKGPFKFFSLCELLIDLALILTLSFLIFSK
ncbi:hypothetical protein C4569_03815 [Candidatus Parcubacteria bacterium]|nr:MAG: hypothetical protein C4569_03815 [Candidatus Parcubacteria bacterium]